MGVISTAAAGAIGYVLAFFAISSIATVRAPFSQEIVAEPLRPTTSAILTLAVALGWGMTAIAGGFAILSLGFSGMFILSAGLAFSSATLTILYFVRRRARTTAMTPA